MTASGSPGRKGWLPPRRQFLTGAALAGGAAAGALAANLGVAAHRYGIGYLARTLSPGAIPDMRDPDRFPFRTIRPAARSDRFAENPSGPAALRAAFKEVGPRHGAADEALEAFLTRTQSTSLLVLQGDRLTYEGYFNGGAPQRRLTSMSMSKSVLALLVVAAIAEGRISSLSAPAEILLPEIPGLRGSGVTLWHLMHMASGLRFEDPRPLGPLSWSRLFNGERVAYLTPDIRAHIATARPGAPPGTHFAYEDRSAQLVGLIIERATGGSVSAFLESALWARIGTEAAATWNLDREDGFEKMESGLNAVGRDWLRLGRLVLRGGQENGETVLPDAPLREVTTMHPDAPGFAAETAHQSRRPDSAYGLLWWGFGAEPQDCFAEGYLGQILYVMRSRDAVLLRTGTTQGGVASWPALLRDLAAALPGATMRRGELRG